VRAHVGTFGPQAVSATARHKDHQYPVCRGSIGTNRTESLDVYSAPLAHRGPCCTSRAREYEIWRSAWVLGASLLLHVPSEWVEDAGSTHSMKCHIKSDQTQLRRTDLWP
jgi:hypothetical protein